MSSSDTVSPKSSVLVLGSAELGTSVLESLATHPNRKNSSIDVSMRPSSTSNPSPSKQEQLDRLRSLQINAIPLDVEEASQSELATVFSQYGTIIGCTGMAGSAGLQMKLAKAAIEVKVPRYIPWQFGVDYDIIGPEAAGALFAAQCDVRSLLRSQTSTRWAVVSVGIFMSFLFENFFGIVERDTGKTTVRAFGDWKNELTATTVEDIGRCTAEIALSSEDVWQGGEGNGRVVYIAGDTITYEQLADILERVTGGKVKRELWTADWLRKKIEEEPDNGIFKYRVIWAEARGVAWDVGSSFNGQRGIPMQTTEDWVRLNIKT